MIRSKQQIEIARALKNHNASHPVEVSKQKRAQWIKNNRVQ